MHPENPNESHDLPMEMPVDGSVLDADLDDAPQPAWAQTLVQILEVQEAALIRDGYNDEDAFKIARKTTLALAEYMGGRSLYIPRGDALRIAIRDAEIFRVANRRNIRQLSRRHNVSERHIWRILNRQQRLHVRKLQPDLFNKPE